jgi:hypothetical protein
MSEETNMAVKRSDAEDPRHPDTVADQKPDSPASAELNPEDYGFRKIEEAEPAEGPGAIEPVRVEPLSSVPNSTFASRAGKSVDNKAVQSAENK